MIGGGGFSMGFHFGATDAATGVMNRVAGAFGRLDRMSNSSTAVMGRMQGAAVGASIGLGAMAAGGAAIGAAFSAASDFSRFEVEMAKVGALSNASTEDLAMLERKALDIGRSSRFAPTEAAMGMAEFAAQGFNARQQMDLLAPALNLAAGGSISVAQSTETMTSAMHVFGLSTDEAALTVDKLLKISNATALQASDLTLALGTVGRGAVAAHQSLDEMLISMGLIKNTGLDTSVAAQSTSSALIAIAKNADAFKKIGVDVTDANGKFRPLLDIMYETDNALKGITNEAERTAKGTELFTRFGMSAFSSVSKQLETGVQDASGNIHKGADALRFLRGEQENAAGAAEEFVRRMANTFEGQQAIAKATAETFKITIGRAFAETIAPAFARATAAMNKLMSAFDKLSPQLKTTIARGIILGGTIMFAAGAVLAAVSAFGLLRYSLMLAGTSFAGMLGALLPVVAGIAAIAAGVVVMKMAIDKNLGGIGDAFEGSLKRVTLFFRAVGQLMTDGFLSGDTREDILGSKEGAGIVSFISVFMRMGARLKAVFEGIGTGFDETFGRMGGIIERLGESFSSLGGFVMFAWTQLDAFSRIGKDSFESVGEAAGGKLADGLGLVAKAISTIVDFNVGLVKGFVAGILVFDKVGGTFGAIRTAAGWIVDAFSGIGEELNRMLEAVGLGEASWEGFGKVLGFMTSVVLIPVQAAVSLLAVTLGGMTKLAEMLVIGIRILVETIVDKVNAALDTVAEGLAVLPDSVRPAAADEFIAARNARHGPGTGAQSIAAGAVELGKQVFGGAEGEGARQVDMRKVAEAMLSSRADAEKSQQDRAIQLRAKLVVDGRSLGEIVAEQAGNLNAAIFGASSPTTVEG